MNNEWKGYGRKRSWLSFELLARHLPGVTDENREGSRSVRIPVSWSGTTSLKQGCQPLGRFVSLTCWTSVTSISGIVCSTVGLFTRGNVALWVLMVNGALRTIEDVANWSGISYRRCEEPGTSCCSLRTNKRGTQTVLRTRLLAFSVSVTLIYFRRHTAFELHGSIAEVSYLCWYGGCIKTLYLL
jgi:hypothetical protein